MNPVGKIPGEKSLNQRIDCFYHEQQSIPAKIALHVLKSNDMGFQDDRVLFSPLDVVSPLNPK